MMITEPTHDVSRQIALNEAAALCSRLDRLRAEPSLDPAIAYQDAVFCMHGIAKVGRLLELAGFTSDEIQTMFSRARAVLAQSTFLNRLQSWPRGYPGDFETIEYLTFGANQAPENTCGWYLEQVALDAAPVQQHRNKVQHQANTIRSTLNRVGPRARILSFACGGCLDFLMADILPGQFEGEILLNDADETALAMSEQRVRSFTARYRLLPGNVLKAVRQIRKEQPFDLALAGGLFDYLSDEAIVLVLRTVLQVLSPSGVFLFTNVAEGNPFRCWMEYGVNWKLTERNENQVRDLCLRAGFKSEHVQITRDSTRLALLVHARSA